MRYVTELNRNAVNSTLQCSVNSEIRSLDQPVPPPRRPPTPLPPRPAPMSRPSLLHHPPFRPVVPASLQLLYLSQDPPARTYVSIVVAGYPEMLPKPVPAVIAPEMFVPRGEALSASRAMVRVACEVFSQEIRGREAVVAVVALREAACRRHPS